jgi:hypothetical protein
MNSSVLIIYNRTFCFIFLYRWGNSEGRNTASRTGQQRSHLIRSWSPSHRETCIKILINKISQSGNLHANSCNLESNGFRTWYAEVSLLAISALRVLSASDHVLIDWLAQVIAKQCITSSHALHHEWSGVAYKDSANPFFLSPYTPLRS